MTIQNRKRFPEPGCDDAANKEGEARPSAPKFRLDPERENAVGIHHGDPDALEKLLSTFAVKDRYAAALLNGHLAELSRGAFEQGDLQTPNGALALLNEMEPCDATETMLCTQMIGSQILAMECLRRANLPDQGHQTRDVSLRHAERLMRIFAQQLDALNKHRGKGQQRVTVEHVSVNEGGQAVVGNIEGIKSGRGRA